MNVEGPFGPLEYIPADTTRFDTVSNKGVEHLKLGCPLIVRGASVLHTFDNVRWGSHCIHRLHALPGVYSIIRTNLISSHFQLSKM